MDGSEDVTDLVSGSGSKISKSHDSEDDLASKTEEREEIGTSDEVKETPARKLLQLLEEKLPEVVTKQKADDFSISFCYCNSRASRKKLTQHLMKIPGGRLELVPQYARIATTLNRIYGDIGTPLVESLFGSFYGMYKAKSPDHLFSKLRNVRYIGELIKFRVAVPITAFKIFKLLLQDMTAHNIEILATFMESCGRFLYLTPYTHEKMEEVLATMQRLRKVKNLDQHLDTLLEAAASTVIPPPPRTRASKSPRTPLQQYIHYLIRTKLEVSNVNAVIKHLRRLPWNKDEVDPIT